MQLWVITRSIKSSLKSDPASSAHRCSRIQVGAAGKKIGFFGLKWTGVRTVRAVAIPTRDVLGRDGRRIFFFSCTLKPATANKF
jgi:hypothetical protein